VEVGHLQDKFTGNFSPTYFHLWLLGSLEDGLVAKVGNIRITGLQLRVSLLRGRGSAALVEKV
jgi:hypothetical protein